MDINFTNEHLTVEGFVELTAANGERFRKQVCTALNGRTTLEIDLSRTTAIDCAGLGALIALQKFARGRNCVVRLLNLTPAVQQLFDLARAGLVFEIVKTPTANQPEEASYSACSSSIRFSVPEQLRGNSPRLAPNFP